MDDIPYFPVSSHLSDSSVLCRQIILQKVPTKEEVGSSSHRLC